MSIKNTVSISEARKRFFEIAEKVQRPGTHFTLTEKGQPKAVILSAEEFESWVETLEIVSDPKAMARIKKAEAEYKRGEYVSWDEMKKELEKTRAKAMVVADRPKKKYFAKKKTK